MKDTDLNLYFAVEKPAKKASGKISLLQPVINPVIPPQIENFEIIVYILFKLEMAPLPKIRTNFPPPSKLAFTLILTTSFWFGP